MKEKVCSRKDCEFNGQPQPLDNFYENERRCKSCEKKRHNIYYKLHPIKLKEKRKKYYNTTHGRFIHYQANAKRKNTVFEIDFEFAVSLFLSDCFYCGEPSSIVGINGIDRKDNNIGYIKSNCVACCENCNFLKNDYDFIFFVQHIKKIYERLNKQGALI